MQNPSEPGPTTVCELGEDAARELAARLRRMAAERPFELGMPRCGLPFAAMIAAALDGDLDVTLMREPRSPD